MIQFLLHWDIGWKKVFPTSNNEDTCRNGNIKLLWIILEILSGADPSLVYEEPGIISWSDAVQGRFTPIYRTALTEKFVFLILKRAINIIFVKI